MHPKSRLSESCSCLFEFGLLKKMPLDWIVSRMEIPIIHRSANPQINTLTTRFITNTSWKSIYISWQLQKVTQRSQQRKNAGRCIGRNVFGNVLSVGQSLRHLQHSVYIGRRSTTEIAAAEIMYLQHVKTSNQGHPTFTALSTYQMLSTKPNPEHCYCKNLHLWSNHHNYYYCNSI